MEAPGLIQVFSKPLPHKLNQDHLTDLLSLTAVLTFLSCFLDAVSLQNQPHSIKKIPWDTLPTFSIIIANKHNLNTWIAHVTQPDIESPSQWSPAVTSCHRRFTSLPLGVLCHGVVQVAVILHRSGLFYTYLSVTFNGRTRGLRYLVNTSIVIHTHSIVTFSRDKLSPSLCKLQYSHPRG